MPPYTNCYIRYARIPQHNARSWICSAKTTQPLIIVYLSSRKSDKLCTKISLPFVNGATAALCTTLCRHQQYAIFPRLLHCSEPRTKCKFMQIIRLFRWRKWQLIIYAIRWHRSCIRSGYASECVFALHCFHSYRIHFALIAFVFFCSNFQYG